MNSYNRGEWSEFYGVLFLLVKPNLNIVNSKMETIDNCLFEVKRITLDSKISLQYDIIDNNIIVYANSEEISKFTKEEIDTERKRLLNIITTNCANSGAFTIPAIDSFLEKMTKGVSFKSKSVNKSDINTLCFDKRKCKNVDLAYSIKSALGSPATILNSSKNTNFKYEIQDFNEEKLQIVNSINTDRKLLDRIHKIYELGGKIKFIEATSKVFNHNLKMVDSLLPEYLGSTLLYSYQYNMKNLKEIFCLANPTLSEDLAIKKLGDFLKGVSFGFMPGSEWKGDYSVNGGLVIIKKDGDLVVLDLMYYPQEVANYLLKETKLDSPSSTRYHMLEIYKENNKFYFTLNLQVRYK